jgi:hypothetical protein
LADHGLDQIADGRFRSSTAGGTTVQHAKAIAFLLDLPKVQVCEVFLLGVKLKAISVIVAHAVGIDVA